MATLTLYDTWTRRVLRGTLGVWGEHWADLSDTEQYAAWCRLAEERGAKADVQYYMTRSLLWEVLYAAGGVEREVGLLRAALQEVQKFANEAIAQHTSREKWPERGRHVSSPSMREASYIFVNLLSWARSTVERTDRPFRPGSKERAGLLPALAPGPLRHSVDKALRELRVAIGDSRSLANYALHAGGVPGGGSPSAEILRDGRILARVPDPLSRPALTWDEFEFTQDRDMLTYASEVLAAIETFVTKVLDAFEAKPAGTSGAAARVVKRLGGMPPTCPYVEYLRCD